MYLEKISILALTVKVILLKYKFMDRRNTIFLNFILSFLNETSLPCMNFQRQMINHGPVQSILIHSMTRHVKNVKFERKISSKREIDLQKMLGTKNDTSGILFSNVDFDEEKFYDFFCSTYDREISDPTYFEEIRIFLLRIK